MAEAVSGRFFLSHGRIAETAARKTVSDLLATISDAPQPRSGVTSGKAHLAVLGRCGSGKTLIAAAYARAILERTKQSVDQRRPIFWDAAGYGPAGSARTPFRPRSSYSGAVTGPIWPRPPTHDGMDVMITSLALEPSLRPELKCPAVLLPSCEDAPAGDVPTNPATLLRLIVGILAALRFMLVIVMTALSKNPDSLAFGLVVLAACLHYGRREEPGDRAFLPNTPKSDVIREAAHTIG